MENRARDPAALNRGAAARIAEAEYLRLEHELRSGGINADAVRANAEALTHRRGRGWTVIERAYLPTGVALGCPLAADTTNHLRRTARAIDRQLAAAAGTSEPALAYVPSGAYHITVANRAHYEHSEPEFLSAEEFRVVRECIARLRLRTIDVAVIGFMVTAHGKLFFKCLPGDDRLLELRTRLVEALPSLAVNLPKTAHMKLAHLRVPVPLEAIDAVTRVAGRALQRLVFSDVYTPHGRIPL